MLKRTITTIAALAVLVPALIFSGTFIFPILVAFFTLIALFEFFRCIGVNRNLWLCLPFYITGAAMPFAVRHLTAPHYGGAALLLAVVLILYLLAIVVISRNKVNITQVSSTFFTAVYIIFAFCGIIFLRDLENGYIYFLIFIASWVTDIFAYLCGMLLGRHKLIPEISPKKTIEGSVGGIVFSTAAFAAASYFFGLTDLVGFVVVIPCGILASCIAQIGDLAMSAVKRQFGVKDFGDLFPGHGGVLDRFDSILAVSAFMTILFAAAEIFKLL